MSLAQIYVVDYTGLVTEAPEESELLGRRPWELCWRRADEERLFAAFVQACMLRRPQSAIRASMRLARGGASQQVELSAWLTPFQHSPSVLVRAYPLAAAELTAQERAVLKLVGLGEPNSEIALALGVSESTVRSHLASVRTKLGVTRCEQLLTCALGVELPRDW